MLVCTMYGLQMLILVSNDITTSSKLHGSDKSTVPESVANFIYAPSTSTSNLRKHLISQHGKEYDKACDKFDWNYRRSTESKKQTAPDKGRELPPFSPASFMGQLVRFIVADDQVSTNNLFFFSLPHKLSVDSCCRMPQVPTTVFISS